MDLSTRLKTYLDRHRLRAIEKIGRGFAAETHLVRDARGKRSVIKIERDDSPRRDFTYKESEYLRAANTVRVGPKLLDADYDLRCVRMEFIDGVPFGKWLLDENKPPTKTKLRKCVRSLLAQAKRLDAAGIDHGQLAGKGANILVTKDGSPVLIDYEKASMVRKPHNRTQLESFLFRNPNGVIAKRIQVITGEDRHAAPKSPTAPRDARA